MDAVQETQLNQFLRLMADRVRTLEVGVTRALADGKKTEEQTWDLWAQLIEHDHCELCGVAVWGNDHTCSVPDGS